MKSNFVTPLLLGSALALGALGFVACGEENNPNIPQPPNNNSSSSFAPRSFDDVTVETAIVFKNLDVSSTTLNKVKFKGDISIDLRDSNTVADINSVHFTDIKFDVVSKNWTSGGVAAPIAPLDLQSQAMTTINLQEIGLYTNLDENYSECGDFWLYITATATDGIVTSVSRDSIAFKRDEIHCQAPESSSSEVVVPGAPLDTIRIKVDTKSDKCLSFATGLATGDATGDVCFKTFGSSGNVQLSSTTGIKFAVFDNPSNNTRLDDWSKNYLPTDPTTDSFIYLESALKEPFPDFLNEVDVFFVAIAPSYVPNSGSATGFYAFVVTETSTPDANGDLSFTLLVYKAK